LFPRQLAFGTETFRDADHAAETFSQSTHCSVTMEPNDASHFALDVRFATNGALIAIDSAASRGGRVLYREPPRSLAIYRILRGAGGVSREGDMASITERSGLIVDTARSTSCFSGPGARTQVVLLPFDEIVEASRRLCDCPLRDDWDWATTFTTDTAIGKGLSGLLEAAVANIELASADEAAATYAMRLAEEALLMFIIEQTGVFARRGVALSDALPSAHQVRSALDLIHSMEGPLTVSDVADHVGVSVRSLQLAFRRIVGASPHNVIKKARLNKARELIESGAVATVQQAAFRLGFSNAARFSAEYSEAFGESPVASLRHARRDRRPA